MMMKELNFPTVYNKDILTGYGGNQEWFSEQIKRRAEHEEKSRMRMYQRSESGSILCFSLSRDGRNL